MSPRQIQTSRGFTLIESVVALLLLSIISLGLISFNRNLFLNSSYSRDMQMGNQLLQACLDQVMAQRRKTGGFDATYTCAAPQNTAYGFKITYPSPLPVFCTSVYTSANCKQVNIQVIRSSDNSGLTAPVTLLFVNY